MANFADTWVGSTDQVALVSATTGDTFSAANYQGPYASDPASNNYWVNSFGQSAALFWANVQRYGVDKAVTDWKNEQQGAAPIPTVVTTNVSVSRNPTSSSTPVTSTPLPFSQGSFQSAESNAGSVLNTGATNYINSATPPLFSGSGGSGLVWLGLGALVLFLMVKK